MIRLYSIYLKLTLFIVFLQFIHPNTSRHIDKLVLWKHRSQLHLYISRRSSTMTVQDEVSTFRILVSEKQLIT